MRLVVKSNGIVEEFEIDKLKRSLDLSFNIVNSPDGQKKIYIDRILKNFMKWLKDKQEITSADIKRIIIIYMEEIHPDVAYIYKNFKKIG